MNQSDEKNSFSTNMIEIKMNVFIFSLRRLSSFDLTSKKNLKTEDDDTIVTYRKKWPQHLGKYALRRNSYRRNKDRRNSIIYISAKYTFGDVTIDNVLFRRCHYRRCAYRRYYLLTNFILITKTKIINWVELGVKLVTKSS